MCGILFSKDSKNRLDSYSFNQALLKQSWRGPDAKGTSKEKFGVHLGHVRLSILDLTSASNQPMKSNCGRYKIIFNGEIYNHLHIRNKFKLNCSTESDTETILEAFSSIGSKIFDELEGMYALVIFNIHNGDWWAARDRFGIKPLFMFDSNGHTIISSETVSIRHLENCNISEQSLIEWQMIRRPIPGATFFNEISEVLPGSIIFNGKLQSVLSIAVPSKEMFSQQMLLEKIHQSITSHELSHVKNVCLLSGGIDSTIITAFSSSKKAYTVGLEENNEILEARSTALELSKNLKEIKLSEKTMINAWKKLIDLRKEPLSVPNEGLIYLVCKSMEPNEKVVLTGEGADEIFFGYDRIYREAYLGDKMTLDKFYEFYSYSKSRLNSERLDNFLNDLMKDKTNIDFLEDFFLQVHLSGLLRRMDMSSMAASKEARVPFVTKNLIDYMYRRPTGIKLNKDDSKIPLREICKNLGMFEPLKRKKVGFSSTIKGTKSRFEEYDFFRRLNMEVLEWL